VFVIAERTVSGSYRCTLPCVAIACRERCLYVCYAAFCVYYRYMIAVVMPRLTLMPLRESWCYGLTVLFSAVCRMPVFCRGVVSF